MTPENRLVKRLDLRGLLIIFSTFVDSILHHIQLLHCTQKMHENNSLRLARLVVFHSDAAPQTNQLKRHLPMHTTQIPDHTPEMKALAHLKTIKTNNIKSDIHSAADKIDHDSIVTNDNPSSNH